MNRLAKEKSPYLLQHAENPVDWFPWCDEAFEKAAAEDKPVFLSIGYSTCHWCHVMAHESFEDEQVAGLMNKTFINIKVDREERPDIDNTYMTACQLLTGQGGWPLTIVMTPGKQPFYAATYLPKQSFQNRIGMLDFVPAIAKAWKHDRQGILQSVQQISEGFQKTLELGKSRASISTDVIQQVERQLAGRFDRHFGGFGSAPKFPSPHTILFLLNRFRISGSADALNMATRTLAQMRLGGIWDHIGFGFHRYSTDQQWRLPHFEKMLYDQALLLLAYADAWQITKNPLFRQTSAQIAAHVAERLTSPDGGFYSAEDADSDGEEGKFYVWSADEINNILSAEDAELFRDLFGFEAGGNFRDEATGQKTGKNIPCLKRTLSEEAKNRRLPEDAFTSKIGNILKSLKHQREKRIRPSLDDKILTDWNGLMIAALARAGAVFQDSAFTNTAEKAWKHLQAYCLKGSTIRHLLKDKESAIEGMADDYAFLIFGLIELYQATFNSEYLKSAMDLQRRFDQLFYDEIHGGYFFTSKHAELLLGRQKEMYDGAIPSSNSTAAYNNGYLGAITGSESYRAKAEKTLAAFSEQISNSPAGYTFAANALQLLRAKRTEIIITAPEHSAELPAILEVCREESPAGSPIILKTEQNRELIEQIAPFTKHYPVTDKPLVYICKNYTCNKPVSTLDEIKTLFR